jgi:hypothetical protein
MPAAGERGDSDVVNLFPGLLTNPIPRLSMVIPT